MRHILLMFFVAVLGFYPANAIAEIDGKIATIPPSTNQILKLTDKGIVPREIRIDRSGSSVFFLNDSEHSLVGIEVHYGTNLSYCASGTMQMHADGVFRSKSPFSPKSFVTVCFPQPGAYPVKVYGLESNPSGEEAIIYVD